MKKLLCLGLLVAISNADAVKNSKGPYLHSKPMLQNNVAKQLPVKPEKLGLSEGNESIVENRTKHGIEIEFTRNYESDIKMGLQMPYEANSRKAGLADNQETVYVYVPAGKTINIDAKTDDDTGEKLYFHRIVVRDVKGK